MSRPSQETILSISTCKSTTTFWNSQICKKIPLNSNELSGCLRGANGNRTSDTRIFSPLLYQLSYGTIAVLRLQRYDFFPHKQNFFLLFRKLFSILLKIKTLYLQKESKKLCFQLKIRSSLPYIDNREAHSFHFFRSSMNLMGLRD